MLVLLDRDNLRLPDMLRDELLLFDSIWMNGRGVSAVVVVPDCCFLNCYH